MSSSSDNVELLTDGNNRGVVQVEIVAKGKRITPIFERLKLSSTLPVRKGIAVARQWWQVVETGTGFRVSTHMSDGHQSCCRTCGHRRMHSIELVLGACLLVDDRYERPKMRITIQKPLHRYGTASRVSIEKHAIFHQISTDENERERERESQKEKLWSCRSGGVLVRFRFCIQSTRIFRTENKFTHDSIAMFTMICTEIERELESKRDVMLIRTKQTFTQSHRCTADVVPLATWTCQSIDNVLRFACLFVNREEQTTQGWPSNLPSDN